MASKFGNKHVIFSPTRHQQGAIELFIKSITKILDARDDVYLILLDNNSEPGIQTFLKSLTHPQIIVEFQGQNIGKARATNEFIAKNIEPDNLPVTLWSMDPDIMIGLESFNTLIEAITNLPDNIKVLGPRYKKNNCNPEMNLWFPPKKIKGNNNKTYQISFPLLCCVAGPILVMTGETMAKTFKYKFFPTANYLPYGNDDTAIYEELRRLHLKSGYLNGAKAIHLRSAEKKADELQAYINN